MFSIFKQASGTHTGILKELSEDQLSEVAGGQAHHHHHKHHHKTTTMPQPVTGTTGTTGTKTTVSSPVTVGGITYPSNSHW